MTTTKKSAKKSPQAIPATKPVPRKGASKSRGATAASVKGKSDAELVADTLAELSKIVATLGTTLAVLVQKSESMANHIIATEEVLAEFVAANGLNLARVNARIRAKIAAGTDNNGNANQAIDVAASIASPLPRR